MSDQICTPLQDCAYRRALPVNAVGYSFVMSNGRALLYRKPKTIPAYWAASLRNKQWRCHHQKLGLSDDKEDGSGEGLSFDRARKLAIAWFQEAKQRRIGIEDCPTGPCRQLNLCPVGSRYSIAHAMADYVDWTFWFRSKSYHHKCLLSANKYILPKLANRCVSDITSTELRRWVNWVEHELSISPRSRLNCANVTPDQKADQWRAHQVTARYQFTYLCRALELAHTEGKTADPRVWRRLLNEVSAIRGRRFGLTLKHCRELVSHAEPNLRELVKSALYTGARSAELLDLQARDVQLRRQAVRIRAKKSPRDRYVTLSPEAHRFFLHLRERCIHEKEVLLKSAKGNPWTHDVARKSLKRTAEMCGLPPGTALHVLRHTHASQMIAAGADPISVARQLGHAKVHTVLRTYLHCADEPAHVQKLQEATLEGLCGFAYEAIR